MLLAEVAVVAEVSSEGVSGWAHREWVRRMGLHISVGCVVVVVGMLVVGV